MTFPTDPPRPEGHQPHTTPAPPGPPPGAYAYGGPGPYAPVKTNTNAVVSLVTSILSWLACPVILAIVGLVTGTIGRRQIREANGAESGDGLALAGIIISIANIVLLGGIIVLALAITLLGSNATSKFSIVSSSIGG